MKRTNFLRILGLMPLLGLTKLTVAKPSPKLRIREYLMWHDRWTEDNIVAGMYVIPALFTITEHDVGYAVSVTKQIGYAMQEQNTSVEGVIHGRSLDKQRYTLNSVADGWVYNKLGLYSTKKELADFLNKGKYRLLTKHEMFFIIDASNKNFLRM